MVGVRPALTYTELTEDISTLQRPAGAAKRDAVDGRRFRNGVGAVVVIPNSHRSTPRILEPPSRHRSPKDAVAAAALVDEIFSSPLEAEAEAEGVVAAPVDAANAKISESEAAAWTAELLPLVKGKITLDKMKIARTGNALREVERAHQRGGFAREMIKVS
jgi:hypothetical protein